MSKKKRQFFPILISKINFKKKILPVGLPINLTKLIPEVIYKSRYPGIAQIILKGCSRKGIAMLAIMI
jgi:hypothetical protein